MNGEHLDEKLWLFLYEELPEEERAAAEAHLHGCAECRARLEEAESLRGLLAQRAFPEPSPELLVEARQALEVALDREQFGWRGWLRGWTMGAPLWSFSHAVTVLAILVIGFSLGWTVRPRVDVPVPEDRGNADIVFAPLTATGGVSDPSAYRIRNITRLAPDPQTGRVMITLEAERRLSFTGSIADPRVRQVLIYTMRNYDNAGIRRDTLDLLRARSADREVRDTLIYAMLHDANDGVRLEALEVVRGLDWSSQIQDVLLEVLQKDSNPGVRIAAVNALVANADQQVLPALRKLAAGDGNTYVRMQCASAVRTLEGEEF